MRSVVMKIATIVPGLWMFGGATTLAQQPDHATPAASPSSTTARESTTQTRPSVPPRAELEKEFQESLTGAKLEGIWQVTGEGGLKGAAPLSDPKPDKYTVASATKLSGDQWVINARIEFGEKDVTVPVPVRVVWAEDTAIITLNELPIPMIGTYSARVMVHHGFYSGVWYCNEKDYGGVVQGRVFKQTVQHQGETQPPAAHKE